MPNTVSLEFAGDASKLAAAGKKAEGVVDDFGQAAVGASEDLEKSSKASVDYTDKIGKLGAGISGISGAFDDAGAAMQAVVDIQNAGREKAQRLARANADVEQAMLDGKQAAIDLEQATNDLNQAQTDAGQASLDLEQAEIDKKQAMLDAKTAQEDYNKAVKEHGKNSKEAQQAAIDLQQAQADATQANLDAEQANNDLNQSTSDYEQATLDASQAVRDGKDAQLDLNDAMAEANPSGLQKWADNLNLLMPILSGVTAVIGLVTAAQWLWNAAQLASPTTWIILAIIALIAVIVLIVTHLDVVKKAWKVAWNWIKDAAAAVGHWFKDTLWNKWIKGAWDAILNKALAVVNWFKKIPGMVKSAFSGLVDILTWPYRTAFNLIATAWNATIGKLHWTIPGWVPGIGGASISAPTLPHFHTGGKVPGTPGSEVLAVLQAGETVTAASGGAAGEMVHVVVKIDRNVLVEAITKGVRHRGGNVQAVLGGANA